MKEVTLPVVPAQRKEGEIPTGMRIGVLAEWEVPLSAPDIQNNSES